MTVKKSKRIFYLDALRAFAILSIIIVHVYAVTRWHVMSEYGPILSLRWIFSQIAGNCFRVGVDLFLMLAGALSLGRVWTIREFLSKRIPRISLPFLFWGSITGVIAILLSYYFGFPFLLKFDMNSIVEYMAGVFMATSPVFMPYWFFWMILGTYLIMPIFNKWLFHSDLAEAEYFLILWLIVCLFDDTLHINFPINLTYFSSPIGFVVLGYYLRHTKRRILNNPYFALALTLFSAVLTMVFVIAFSSINEFYVFDRYSLLMALEIVGVFLLFKNFHKFNIKLNLNEKLKNVFKKIILDIAKYSYGIYLIQGLFLCIYVNIVPYYEYYSNFISIFILIVLSSMIVMYVFDRIPNINKFIGAK